MAVVPLCTHEWVGAGNGRAAVGVDHTALLCVLVEAMLRLVVALSPLPAGP